MNVAALSDSSTSSNCGKAAPTKAIGRCSRRQTCCITEPNCRISSMSAPNSSSRVMIRPVPLSARASPSADSTRRRSSAAPVPALSELVAGSNSTPNPAAVMLLIGLPGSASSSSSSRAAARARRPSRPVGEASSDTASQPRARAKSSTALSITVLPAPRTPRNKVGVVRVGRPGCERVTDGVQDVVAPGNDRRRCSEGGAERIAASQVGSLLEISSAPLFYHFAAFSSFVIVS